MAETLLKFDHVEKNFDDKTVINDFNLQIKTGELLVLVGVSGSGKTTTLKMINRLEQPTGGQIYYHDQPIENYNLKQIRWNMGYVLQEIALFPTMTVAQNIAVIPEMKKMPKEKIDHVIDALLEEVGLDPQEYKKAMPDELSGGEQQRVGILRAIASSPEIVLMDEPFSALDPISRTALQDLVLKLHEKLKTTIVFVTHDMGEALKMGDRIAVMKEGKLLQVDTPTEIAQHPKNQFVADFFDAARAKNIYDVYLGRIGVAGYYHETAQTTDAVKLDVEATLRDGLYQLKTHSELQIVTADDQTKGFLDQAAIINYLSDHEKA
jgi:osmoprotectant transport system ATP-binding protein